MSRLFVSASHPSPICRHPPEQSHFPTCSHEHKSSGRFTSVGLSTFVLNVSRVGRGQRVLVVCESLSLATDSRKPCDEASPRGATYHACQKHGYNERFPFKTPITVQPWRDLRHPRGYRSLTAQQHDSRRVSSPTS